MCRKEGSHFVGYIKKLRSVDYDTDRQFPGDTCKHPVLKSTQNIEFSALYTVRIKFSLEKGGCLEFTGGFLSPSKAAQHC